jgi:hypothetical protein
VLICNPSHQAKGCTSPQYGLDTALINVYCSSSLMNIMWAIEKDRRHVDANNTKGVTCALLKSAGHFLYHPVLVPPFDRAWCSCPGASIKCLSLDQKHNEGRRSKYSTEKLFLTSTWGHSLEKNTFFPTTLAATVCDYNTGQLALIFSRPSLFKVRSAVKDKNC